MITANESKAGKRLGVYKQVTVDKLAQLLPLPSTNPFHTNSKLFEYHAAYGQNYLDPIYEFVAKEPSACLVVEDRKLEASRLRANHIYGEAAKIWAKERERAWRNENEDWKSEEEKWAEATGKMVAILEKLGNASNPTSPAEGIGKDRRITRIEDSDKLTGPWHNTSKMPEDSYAIRIVSPSTMNREKVYKYIFIDHEFMPWVIVYKKARELARNTSYGYLRDNLSEFISEYTIKGINGEEVKDEIEQGVLVDILVNALETETALETNNYIVVPYSIEQQLDNWLGNDYTRSNIVLISMYRRMFIDPFEEFHVYDSNIKTIYSEDIDTFKLGKLFVREIDEQAIDKDNLDLIAKGKRWIYYPMPDNFIVNCVEKILKRRYSNDLDKTDKAMRKYLRGVVCYNILKFWRDDSFTQTDDIVLFSSNLVTHQWAWRDIFQVTQFAGKWKELDEMPRHSKDAARDTLHALVFNNFTKIEASFASYIIYLLHTDKHRFTLNGFRKYYSGIAKYEPDSTRLFIDDETLIRNFRNFVYKLPDPFYMFQSNSPITELKNGKDLKLRISFEEAYRTEKLF